MTRKELNNLIKEELEAAVQGHPSYLDEAEDMEPGEMEGGEEDAHEDLMGSLQDFYEKLKAHFEGEEEMEDEGGEEKTKEEEDEMEKDEEDPEEVEEGRKKKAKKGDEGEKEKEEVEEIALNESVKRFQKLANIRG